MDKIAIISDVHGNLPALEAVFSDIEEREISQIYCLGDTVARGGQQAECVERVREKCAVVIRGNCDEYWAESINSAGENISGNEAVERSKITPEMAKYLGDLPFSHEFYLSGRLVRLVHAHPMAIDRTVRNLADGEEFYSLVLPSGQTVSQEKADILVYGHIHIQLLQRMYHRTILNPGSVGYPIEWLEDVERDGCAKGVAIANYLVLSGELDGRDLATDVGYEFVSVAYEKHER